MRFIMRLAQIGSATVLCGSVSLAIAQSYGSAQMEGLRQPSTASVAQKLGLSCPVSLRAQHGADGTMLKVDETRPEGLAQRLHLIVAGPQQKRIVSARLRVRGVSGKGRVSRTDAIQNDADAIRNVAIQLNQSSDNEATADVWIPGMSAILEVELTSVAFADGGVTRFSAADGCRFTPEHLMLVDSSH